MTSTGGPVPGFHVAHEGEAHLIGTWRDAYQIRVRDEGQSVVATFPGSADGWSAAWRRFTDLEERARGAVPHHFRHTAAHPFAHALLPDNVEQRWENEAPTRSYLPDATSGQASADGAREFTGGRDAPAYVERQVSGPFSHLPDERMASWRLRGVVLMGLAVLQWIAAAGAVAAHLGTGGRTAGASTSAIVFAACLWSLVVLRVFFATGMRVFRAPGDLRGRKYADAVLVYATTAVVFSLASAVFYDLAPGDEVWTMVKDVVVLLNVVIDPLLVGYLASQWRQIRNGTL